MRLFELDVTTESRVIQQYSLTIYIWKIFSFLFYFQITFNHTHTLRRQCIIRVCLLISQKLLTYIRTHTRLGRYRSTGKEKTRQHCPPHGTRNVSTFGKEGSRGEGGEREREREWLPINMAAGCGGCGRAKGGNFKDSSKGWIWATDISVYITPFCGGGHFNNISSA